MHKNIKKPTQAQRFVNRLDGTTAPDMQSLVNSLATSPETSQHTLTDGTHTVSYSQLPTIFDHLDRAFAARKITKLHPLALECSQTVAGAVALIYSMSRGHDLVLLPELGTHSKESGTPRFIPNFCPWVVTAPSITDADSDIRFPDRLLNFESHENYHEEPLVTRFQGPDLYLRTSGSTGKPKLARMSHQKWLDNALGCVERWALKATDRLAVPVPIFHSYGFGAAFLPGLLVGASMDIQGSFNILRYLAREEHFNPNVAFLTPALADSFVRVRRTPRLYRLAVTAGDKVKKATMSGFESSFGPLLNLYGSAEMGAVSSASPSDPPQQRLATAGYPLQGVELRLEDDGTLACRQNHGFAGYLVQEDGWRFYPRADHEWFRTGDLAQIRDDGYLTIVGRSGLSTKRDGLLVVFADVESTMETFEELERVVVFTHGESQRGSRLVAACVSKEPSLEIDAIRRACREKMPLYAVPDEIILIDSLPLLPNGKIDRQTLPKLL